MKTTFNHIYTNVSDLDFYKDLLEFLEFKPIFAYPDGSGFGMTDGHAALWFMKTQKEFLARGFHRKGLGLNHLAFSVRSKEDVDRFYKEFVQAKKLPVLYGGPKQYPEYTPSYYAVYFEDPDRIKLEVLYNAG